MHAMPVTFLLVVQSSPTFLPNGRVVVDQMLFQIFVLSICSGDQSWKKFVRNRAKFCTFLPFLFTPCFRQPFWKLYLCYHACLLAPHMEKFPEVYNKCAQAEFSA